MASVIRNGTVVLARPWVSLYLRLPIDPSVAASLDYRFELTGGGGSYRQAKTIHDDLVAGDGFTDLIFTRMRADWKYSLRVDPGKEGDPYFLFEDVPYPGLAKLFGPEEERVEESAESDDPDWGSDELERDFEETTPVAEPELQAV